MLATSFNPHNNKWNNGNTFNSDKGATDLFNHVETTSISSFMLYQSHATSTKLFVVTASTRRSCFLPIYVDACRSISHKQFLFLFVLLLKYSAGSRTYRYLVSYVDSLICRIDLPFRYLLSGYLSIPGCEPALIFKKDGSTQEVPVRDVR